VTKDQIQQFCDLAINLVSRIFSATRAFTFAKISIYGVAAATMAFGIKASGSVDQRGSMQGEINLTEPGLAQVLVVAVVTMFAMYLDYCALKLNREFELHMERIRASAPNSLRKRLRSKRRS
jgi:hypothetical protein